MRVSALFFCLLVCIVCICTDLKAQVSDEQKEKVCIYHIDIQGNEITRSSIVLRELNISEGDSILRSNIPVLLAENKRRLLNLTLFTKVELESFPSGPHRLDLRIVVNERWHIIPKPIFQLADRNFNVWWTEMHRDLRRINAGIKITDNNFRGNLESLSAIVQVGYTQQLALEYIRPYFDKLQRQGFGISISSSQSGELAYKTDSNKLLFARLPGTHIIRQYDIAGSWYYRPAYAWKHSLTLAWHQSQVSDTVLKLNADYLGNSRDQIQYADLSYRLDYNGVDNWNYPTRGIKSVNIITLRRELKEAVWQTQWHTETGIFKQGRGLWQHWLGDAIVRSRISLQSDVPYLFQTALGTKTDYLRGYEYYVVDGSDYGLFRLDLKYALLNKRIEKLPFQYLPEVPMRLYPKLFADIGAAHNPTPGNSFLNDRLLFAGGLGLDIVTAYDVKIRIEAAINHLGQYGLYLHLNSE